MSNWPRTAAARVGGGRGAELEKAAAHLYGGMRDGDGAVAAGATALGAWAADRRDEYRVVQQRRDADRSMVERALELVRKFIVDRELVLYGGQAIDYALRLRGTRLYPDDERPDYDFFSPRNVDDAYDLADILVGEGFPNVSAIRAIHAQTMKVRVDGIPVADIGYMPPAVFAAIPWLSWQGIRSVHPDYQRLDMHLAFCYPFQGAPREDIFHRWKKDLQRFALVEEHYPVTSAAPEPTQFYVTRGELAVPLAVPLAGAPGGAAGGLPAVALTGFAAFELRRQRGLRRPAQGGGGAPAQEVSGTSGVYFPDERTCTFLPPLAGQRLEVVTPDPRAALAGRGDLQWFDPYLDVVPLTAVSAAAGVRAHSTRHRMYAVEAVDVCLGGRDACAGAPTHRVLVASGQGLALWFLAEAHRAPAADPGRRALYLRYYLATLDLCHRDAANPAGLSVQVLGAQNLDVSYIINMFDRCDKVRDPRPPAALGLDAADATLGRDIPARGYYPSQGKPRPPFAGYETSVLFRRAGAPRPAEAAAA